MFLIASRHNMPAYGLHPAVYGPLEERFCSGLGDAAYQRATGRGDVMDDADLMVLAGAG